MDATISSPRSTTFKIFIIGIVAGTLDIVAACIHAYINNPAVSPDRVFRFVASGLFGSRAFTGGDWYAVAGLFLHYALATCFASVFILVAPKWKYLMSYWFFAGIVYGLLVWGFMSWVVLPLSLAPPLPFQWKSAIEGLLIIICMIGLPVAWLNRLFTTRGRHQ